MMAFNALPSVVILSMMGMNNIAAAGKTLFFKGLVAQLAGALTVSALLGFPSSHRARRYRSTSACR